MGGVFAKQKDGTAQGVAKVRHQESLYPPEQSLHNDPFAYAMFPGSIVQQWMGTNVLNSLYRWAGLAGLCEMLSIRTKWLDDQILMRCKEEGEQSKVKHIVILGAGYDTRGFRLDLWKDETTEDLTLVEVDQPEVQQKKMAKLNWLAQHDANGHVISERLNSMKVRFLPVDFNADDLQQKLAAMDGFTCNRRTIVVMEGVTQYIPKQSTEDTLNKIKSIVAPNSILLITYVDEKCFPGSKDYDQGVYRTVRNLTEKAGEPWISGWTKEGFGEFVRQCGYEVLSDTSPEDYNETYMKDVGRIMDQDDILSMERFMVAKVL